MSMTLIEHIEVGAGGANEIVLDNIPADYTDLMVVLSTRLSSSSTFVSLGMFINSAAADTSWRRLSGNGSSASSGSATGATDYLIGDVPDSSATSNTFANSYVYIPNYTSSNAKSISSDSVGENNATASNQIIIAGLCSKTAAVTSLTFRSYGGSPTIDFVQYSSATLYGITAGSDGTTVVS